MVIDVVCKKPMWQSFRFSLCPYHMILDLRMFALALTNSSALVTSDATMKSDEMCRNFGIVADFVRLDEIS